MISSVETSSKHGKVKESASVTEYILPTPMECVTAI